MGNFKSDWHKFLAWVRSRDSASGKSSMWQNLVGDFAIADPAVGPRQLFTANKFRSYNLLRADQETPGVRARKALLGISYFAARALTFVRGRIWQANIGGLGSGELAFHPAGERWLQAAGLYPDYRRFCESFGLSTANSSAIKSFYVSSVMAATLKDVPRPRILEIGGGTGVLASIAQFRLRPQLYVIVDLPEMLLVSSMSITALFPDLAARFIYPGSSEDPPEGGLCFCTPDALDRLAPDSFDLGVNIDSFQEMTQEQVATYLELGQRVVANGGFMLNLNRRKYLEAEKFDNNPLMYPYDPANRILRWETDPFMERTFNYDRTRVDGWILRVERVVKASRAAG